MSRYCVIIEHIYYILHRLFVSVRFFQNEYEWTKPPAVPVIDSNHTTYRPKNLKVAHSFLFVSPRTLTTYPGNKKRPHRWRALRHFFRPASNRSTKFPSVKIRLPGIRELISSYSFSNSRARIPSIWVTTPGRSFVTIAHRISKSTLS